MGLEEYYKECMELEEYYKEYEAKYQKTLVEINFVSIIQSCLMDWGHKSYIRELANKTGGNIIDDLFELTCVKEMFKDAEILTDEEGNKYIWNIDTSYLYPDDSTHVNPNTEKRQWAKCIDYRGFIYENKIALPQEFLDVLKKHLDTWKDTEIENYINGCYLEMVWQLNELYITTKTMQDSKYVLDAYNFIYNFVLVKDYIKK
jgi:hypothetical protein